MIALVGSPGFGLQRRGAAAAHDKIAGGKRSARCHAGELDSGAGTSAIGIVQQRARRLVVDDPVVGVGG